MDNGNLMRVISETVDNLNKAEEELKASNEALRKAEEMVEEMRDALAELAESEEGGKPREWVIYSLDRQLDTVKIDSSKRTVGYSLDPYNNALAKFVASHLNLAQDPTDKNAEHGVRCEDDLTDELVKLNKKEEE